MYPKFRHYFRYILDCEISKKIQDIDSIYYKDSTLSHFYQSNREEFNNRFFELTKITISNYECMKISIDKKIIEKSLKHVKCFECIFQKILYR